jgi:hypothetical protein
VEYDLGVYSPSGAEVMFSRAPLVNSRESKRDEMTLQDRLDAFKADFEAGKPPYNVPPSVIVTMHRATAELIASGRAERAKKAGDIAPSFTLNDADGRTVGSASCCRRVPWC